MSFWRFLKSKGNPSQTIVFFHGTGNDHLFGMYPLFEALLNLGFNIFTFDLDGHGSQSSTKISIKGFHSTAKTSLTFFKISWPEQSIHLLGNSLGGLVALEGLSTKLPVQSLTLLGVPRYISVSPSSIVPELLSPAYLSFLSYLGKWQGSVLPSFGNFNRKNFPIRIARQSKPGLSYIPLIQEITNSFQWPEHAEMIPESCLSIFGGLDLIASEKDWQGPLRDHMNIEVVKGCNHFILPFHNHSIELILGHFRKFL